MLDIFKTDAFGVVSLTTAVDKLPYRPKRLGEMGLFKKEGITTTTVAMEERHGVLSLVQTAARGTTPRTELPGTRKTRAFPVNYLPQLTNVMADEVQGVRAFGKEDATEGVMQKVNDKLQNLKDNVEATVEWHRMGAIKGVTLDADGSTTLFDWYDEFGLTQQVLSFDFSSANLSVPDMATAAIQLIEDALGGTPYTAVRAICGNLFFRNLVSHASVRDAFKQWQTGIGSVSTNFTTTGASKRKGFEFADIVWENYRGYVGSSPFMPTDECRFVVEGVPGLFMENYAPAPFNETVNTVGKPWYAKQEPLKFDMGIELLVVSCPLCWCTRPATIIKGLRTGSVTGLYTMPAGPLA